MTGSSFVLTIEWRARASGSAVHAPPNKRGAEYMRASTGSGNNKSEEVTMAFLQELWAFLRTRKKFWLIPVIFMVAVFGGLIVLSNGSALAPFIYTLF